MASRPQERDTEGAVQGSVRVLIRAASADQLRTLLREEDLDVNCGGAQVVAGEWSIEAYVSPDEADRLSRRAGYTIEIDRDFTRRIAARRAEVGDGDRYQGGRTAPLGLGRKE